MAVSRGIWCKPGRVKHLQKEHQGRDRHDQAPPSNHPRDSTPRGGTGEGGWFGEVIPRPPPKAIIPLGLATLLGCGEGHKWRARLRILWGQKREN